jgi:hypothetical protein
VLLSPCRDVANIPPPDLAFAGQKREVGNRDFGGEVRPDHMEVSQGDIPGFWDAG